MFRRISCRPPLKFQVQAKIPTIQPVFLNYLSVSYDYAVRLQTCVTNEVVYFLSLIKDDVWYVRILPLLNFSYKLKINLATWFTKKVGSRIGSSFFKVKWEVLPVKLAALL